MTNLDSILKSRDITLPTKVRLVKAMVFPVVMYGCELDCEEGWALKKWCWRRLLRVPWTARRSNQSILKEISPGISLEGMMLRLKLQYFGHLMRRLTHWKRLWCWEGLGAGGEGENRGWDGWMASLTRWTLSLSELRELVMDREAWHAWFMGSQRVRHDWPTDLIWSGGSDGKESICNAEDPGLTPGLGRSPGEGNGNPFSILAWKIPWIEETGRLPGGITKSQTQLID